MNDAVRLMKNTLLLTASSVFLRLCALCFQSYLAAKIGAEEMGVFGIIASVGIVFATVSISGVRFGVTRLASEEINCGNKYPRALMRAAYRYALFFGTLSGGAMYFFADFLSMHWVMSESAAFPLRIMSFAMPLIALGSCAEGYFTAKQKISGIVAVQCASQLLRMFFVVISFRMLLKKGIYPSDVLAGGFLLSEGVCAIALMSMYAFETLGKKETAQKKNHLFKLLKTATPLAISAYMRTGLSSLGQIIIPLGLKKAGMGTKSAFSTYGVIGQMSLPVIMFPAALLSAMGEILVPRLTAAQVKKQTIGISYIVNRAMRIGMIFSFGVSGIMLFFAQPLGEALYKSSEASLYIRIFAPIIPIIYIDSVTDGCLKGLGQQLHSMMYNVFEGVLNVILLYFLLPKTAITGYIAVMYIKEIFNAVLSMRRLCLVTSVDFKLTTLLCVTGSVPASWALCSFAVPRAGLIFKMLSYAVIYAALLYITDAVSRDDIKWIFSLVRVREKSCKKQKSWLTKEEDRGKILR